MNENLNLLPNMEKISDFLSVSRMVHKCRAQVCSTSELQKHITECY